MMESKLGEPAEQESIGGARAIVKQVSQVMELFEYFSNVQRPVTLAEIAANLGWPKSSTSNLLTTLRTLSYLYEPGGRKGLYPTPKWIEIAEKIREGDPAPEATSSILDSLVRATGETAALAAPNGLNNIMMMIRESPSAVRFAPKTGDSYPLCNSASGRALMSLLSAPERERIIQRSKLVKLTPHTLIGAAEIESEILSSQKRGWFMANQELQLGLKGVAVPVNSHGRHYAILVAGPAERMTPKLKFIVSTLKEAVADHF